MTSVLPPFRLVPWVVGVWEIWWELPMTTVVFVLQRYLAPFAMGICMAAAATVDDEIAVVALLGVAGILAYLSSSSGGRAVMRIAGATS
jgi:hypothetical protein